MDDGGRRCALPGCDVEIETASGRPERRYCGARHRAAARQARRAAVHAQRREASAGGLAEALPWLPGAAPDDRGAGPRPADPDAAGPVLRPVTPRPGIPHPPGTGEPGAVARAAARRSPDNRPGDGRRHRRTLAMIGVAGVLAGGYAVTAGPDAPAPPAPAPPVPAQVVVPEAEPADAWARRATAALAAVNGGLDTLAQAEAQWEELPASRTGAVPAPVAALREHRAVLQRRRADLQTQLEAYRALRATQRDLAGSEAELQALEKALADAPPPRRSAEQEAAALAVTEQRDLRIHRRDAQRAALVGLSDRVAAAVRAPLPDDGAVTSRVGGDVLALVRDGRAPQPRDTAPRPRPDGTGGPAPDDGTARRDADDPPSTPRRADGGRGDGDGATPREPVAAPGSGRDVLARLHEQARRVAREARQAEGERRLARWGPGWPATAPGPVAHRADGRVAHRADGRVAHRADGRVALRADDDGIEESNAARWARSAAGGGARDHDGVDTLGALAAASSGY